MNASVHRQLARRKRRILRRLEHIEVRRNDEVYLDALGAQRIPDPTTAGDFCRRFTEGDVEQLMDTFNEARLRAWKQQPAEFFAEAFIDADGALAPSDAWCTSRSDATTRSTSMPWAPNASPTRPPPETSAAASPRAMSSG